MAGGSRRFPPHRRTHKIAGGYVVRDANGQALTYLYSRGNEGDALQAKVLTAEVARRIAINIARLAELLGAGELTERAMQQMLARSVYCQIAAAVVQKQLRLCKNRTRSYVETSGNSPFDEDISVLVSDGCRSSYVLLKPCQQTQAGWVVSGKKTPLAVVPLKWMFLQRIPLRARHRLAVTTLERLARELNKFP